MPQPAPQRTADDLALALRRVIAQVVLTNELVARRVGLHVADSQALHLLTLADQPMTAGELGAAARLPSSTTTRTVDRLEKAGYVRRVPDPADRRRVYLHVVEERVAELAAQYDAIAVGMAEVLADFDRHEIDVIARFLEAMASADEGVRP